MLKLIVFTQVRFLLSLKNLKHVRQIINNSIRNSKSPQMKKQSGESIFHEKAQEATEFMEDDANMDLLVRIKPALIGNNYWILITKSAFQIINATIPLLYFLSNQPIQSKYIILIDGWVNDFVTGNLQKRILALSLLITIIIVLNIFYYSLSFKDMPKIIIIINQKLNSLLSPLIQINITVLMLMFLKDSELRDFKMACLILIFVVSAFFDTFMQCTSMPSDLLHSYHPLFIVSLRISTLILLFTSIIYHHFQLSQFIILTPAILFLIIIFSAYLKKGYRTYRNSTSKYFLMLTVTCFFTTCIGMFIAQNINRSFFNFLFTLIIIFIILFFMVRNKSNFAFNPTNYGLNDIEILLASFQELVDHIKVDQKCFLVGLLYQHKSWKCQNIHCYSHKKSVYCTVLESDVDINNQLRFDSVFRYFIKCFFEQNILKQPQNVQIVLRYCEYAYYEMSNILPIAIQLERLQKVRLSLYQQVRVYNLKKTLREDMGKSGHAGLNNRLPFQRVNQYDDACASIAYANRQLIQHHIGLWKIFSSSATTISKVLSAANAIANSCQIVENRIRSLESNLGSWPKLRQLLAFYALFQQNSFKKEKTIRKYQRALAGINEQQVSKNYLNEKGRDKGDPILSVETAFGEGTAIIHARLVCDRLLIKHCSKWTSRVLGFGKQDLIECNMEDIMPNYFHRHHAEKLAHWMDQGFVNLERFETGVAAFCLAKGRRIRGVTKTFKLFISDESQVEFVCLLKEDPMRSNAAVCNKWLQIEEVSRQFEQIFQITPSIQQEQQRPNMQELIPNISSLLIDANNQASQKADVCQCLKINNQSFTMRITTLNYGQEKYLFTFKPINGEIKGSLQAVQLKYEQNQFEKDKVYLKHMLLEEKEEKISENIFMKEESMIPNRSMKEMTHIKYTLHTFFLILIIIFAAMMAISNSNYLNLEDYINKYELFIKVSKEPFLLGIRYYLLQSNISDQSHLIEERTDKLLDLIKADTFKQTIFDSSFKQYSFSNISAQITEKIDVYYTIISSITSLRDNPRDHNSIDYQNFDNLLFPYFYDIIDSINDDIYQAFQGLYSNISVPNLILLEAQSGLFVLVVILITYKFIILCRKLKEVFKLIVKIDNQQLKGVIEYWHSISVRFASFQADNVSQKIVKESHKEIQDIESDEKIVRQQRCLYFTAIFSLSFKFLITAALEIFISSEISDLKGFGDKSQPFIDFYPSSTALGFGIMQKYYNLTFLNSTETQYDVFVDAISNNQQVKKISYMASSIEAESPFYSALKNYYFANPCTFNPNVLTELNISLQQCTLEGHLDEGIVSFELQIQPVIQDYLSNKILISQSQIEKIARWTIVVDSYLEEIISIWASQFISRVQYARTLSIGLYLLMGCLIIIIHYLVAHRSFILHMDTMHQQYIRMYNFLMTNNTIQKNKIIRSQLISLGFLNQ